MKEGEVFKNEQNVQIGGDEREIVGISLRACLEALDLKKPIYKN